MATAETTSTKDQVRDLMDNGETNAQAIADALGVTKATVYVHMRNINTERGIKPRGRGRPPKVEGQATQKAASRPAPPKAGQKAAPKAKAAPAKAPATKAASPTKQAAPTPAQAATNGHSAFREDFPEIYKSIEAELSKARKNVARLERMLEAVSK